MNHRELDGYLPVAADGLGHGVVFHQIFQIQHYRVEVEIRLYQLI